jgi:hypothetical protein
MLQIKKTSRWFRLGHHQQNTITNIKRAIV